MRLLFSLFILTIGVYSYPGYYNYYDYSNYPSYGGYYQQYPSVYYPVPVGAYGGPNYIYPGYGGWINPLGTGSGWAAGGGLIGNAISFFVG